MSPRRIALAAAAAALVAACGGSTQPAPKAGAKPAAAAAKPAAQPAAASAAPAAPEQKPAEKPAQAWAYSSVGKRDPFRSFLTELARKGGELATRCATPLGRFELEQLKLVAVVTGLENPVAMVQAPNGVGYSLRRGACIGKNGGTVAAVRSGEVVVAEWAIRADGTRERTQTVIRLPREAALNLEESQ
jgi:type IV pilus assembly protein PilP